MNNTYGTVRPATIDIESDVEVWYHYRPSRTTEDSLFQDFKKLEPTSVLTQARVSDDNTFGNNLDTKLPGMYNLSLPASIFARKGFYTVYIKPKEMICEIYDVGALAKYPDVAGVVLNLNQIQDDRAKFGNDQLVGYRVEYFDTNGNREPFYRIITSNNFASPMSRNLTNANMNVNGYRYSDSGGLVFITLTPSTMPNFENGAKPYIGTPNQRISISNTKFDPVCVEIEICDVDFDTLDTSINGSQIRSLDKGIVTTYNRDNEAYVQHSYYTIKNNYTQRETHEVRKRETENFDNSVDVEEMLNE